MIWPKILGSPKVTTFQHYLTQEAPDQLAGLKHYATPPAETAIRGHKLYWRRKGVDAASLKEAPEKLADKESQHTGIKPVKPGVTFRFRVRFENLSDEELGALLWVLRLPAGHCHALGMGKPLGMGSVRITPTLVLSQPADRRATLFDARGNWALAEAP
ncbi:MAG: TIGR03986 family CRISPR-associated RAMP protein, partial [Deltaproteobacteria bacterium]